MSLRLRSNTFYMDIEIKDRDQLTEYIRMGLNMVGIGVDYKTTVLLTRVVDEVKKKKGQFSIDHGSNILVEWQNEMEEYSAKQKLQCSGEK